MKAFDASLLPDVLKMRDGTPVEDLKDWEEKRRPEILDFFAGEVYGRWPADPGKTGLTCPASR